MTPSELQQRLVTFGSKLSPELQAEYRDLLDKWSLMIYNLGEIYKMAYIDLLPSKTQVLNKLAIGLADSQKQSLENIAHTVFTPTKKENKGDPLSELLHNLSETDKAKLVTGLEKKLGSQ